MKSIETHEEIQEFDELLESICDVFITIKNDGLEKVEIQNQDELAFNYLQYGITLIKKGLSDVELAIYIEYKFLELIKETARSTTEMMKLVIVKNVIPIIYMGEFDKFLAVAKRFGSNNVNDNITVHAMKYNLSPMLIEIYRCLLEE